MKRLKLGKIIGAVGLKGEVRVYPYTDYKEKFEELPYVFLGEEDRRLIEKIRYMKNMAILKLKGVDDRNQAEACKDQYLYILKEDAPSLEEGSYYIHDLIGLRVEERGGELLGSLKDVIQNAAQDLYEIQRPDGKIFLLPAVEEFIEQIDLERGCIIVHLIPGMMD